MFGRICTKEISFMKSNFYWTQRGGISIFAMSLVMTLSAAIVPSSHAQDQTDNPLSRLDGSAPRTDGSDPVLAIVNGLPIRRSEVLDTAGSLPREYQNLPLEMVYPRILDRIIDIRLIGAKGRAADLDQDAEVRRRIYEATEKIIEEVYLTRFVEDQISESKLRAEYDSLLATVEPGDEIKVRHILVGSEGRARELISRLKDGADFESLARENSLGPEASRGGDLGFIGPRDMVPEFTDAAYALEPGDVSEAPVRSPFGWHVITVVEKRTLAPPSFEELRPNLVARLSEQVIREHLDKLRSEAAIQRFDLPDGSGDILVGAQQTPFGPLQSTSPGSALSRTAIPQPPSPPGSNRAGSATPEADRDSSTTASSDPVRPPASYRPSPSATDRLNEDTSTEDTSSPSNRDRASTAAPSNSRSDEDRRTPAVAAPERKPQRTASSTPSSASTETSDRDQSSAPEDAAVGEVKPPASYRPSVPARVVSPSEEELPSARVRLPLGGGNATKEENANGSAETISGTQTEGGSKVRLR